MAIINSKERTPGPLFYLLELGLYNVKDYADSILIIVADHSLVSVRCISHNYAVLLRSKLSWIVLLFKLLYLLALKLNVLKALAYSHFHAPVIDNLTRVVDRYF